MAGTSANKGSGTMEVSRTTTGERLPSALTDRQLLERFAAQHDE